MAGLDCLAFKITKINGSCFWIMMDDDDDDDDVDDDKQPIQIVCPVGQ